MSSYKSIAKSSGLIAGVQIAQMFFSLLRNKAISIILGSSAFGFYSIYNTFIEMGAAFAVLGIDNSVVRELSRCNEDKEAIGKVLYISNRILLVFSVIVSTLIVVFADKIGFYLFNEAGHDFGVRCVAFIVLFSVAAREGYAVLNGVRSLKKLAVSQIISSGLGSIGIVVAILLWREKSIPIALGIIYVTMSVVTCWYIKKDGLKEHLVSSLEFIKVAKGLIYIGLGVAIAGAISTVMTMMSKSFLTEHYSLSAVGFYQSSWTISNLYTGIILSAMGVDFMPRLSKIIDNKEKATELINQQIIFGVVLSSIAISGILLFSQEILYILYAKEFMVASSIVKWHIVGVFLRVIAFPFSYTILAKGNAKQYAIIQAIFWIGDYLLLIFCSHFWGFNGLGMNYPIAYFGFLAMTFFAAKKICGFYFSKELKSVLLKLSLFIAISWGLSCIEINNLFLGYSIRIMILIVQLYFVFSYLKNKMKLDIMQLIKSKI